ncbi:DUF2069 domain-containing protein [Paenalcaligenes niemegkensis]|uniref:DUF2069 domain-containing protein n=1 Tax=Paenalcaligenes niemegkensis TaxID=2895469 RepID=UPI001EE87B42|nr:DUF2069 domain-containing protein [Paenalcaligenes niemegkensis]MCQ9616216.1 DUF2069 domain-containing protein [Paenalcaligenes niemegkensis]
MEQRLNPVLHRVAAFALLALIILCLGWELWWAPLRPGGSYLVLKVIPLLFPLRGVLKGNLYTLQWASMLVLLYFMEGCVRAWSDPGIMSVYFGIAEIVLSSTFYFCAIFYLWPAKKAAKYRARQSKETANSKSDG